MATKRKKKAVAAAPAGYSSLKSSGKDVMVAFSASQSLQKLIDARIADIQKKVGVSALISRAAICKGIVEDHFSK